MCDEDDPAFLARSMSQRIAFGNGGSSSRGRSPPEQRVEIVSASSQAFAAQATSRWQGAQVEVGREIRRFRSRFVEQDVGGVCEV